MKREIFEIQNELRKARSEIASLRSLVKAQSHKPFRIALTKADTGGYPAESTTTGMYPVVFLDPAFGGDHVERQAEVRLRIRQLLPVHIPVNTEVPVWNYAGGYYTAYAGAGGGTGLCCDWMELVNTILKAELTLTTQEEDDLDAALEACCPQGCVFSDSEPDVTYNLTITLSGITEYDATTFEPTTIPHAINGDYGVAISKDPSGGWKGTFLIGSNICTVIGNCNGSSNSLYFQVGSEDDSNIDSDGVITAENTNIGPSPWSGVLLSVVNYFPLGEAGFYPPLSGNAIPNFSNVTITFSGS